MGLSELLEKIGDQFKADAALAKDQAVEICSGGLREDGVLPCLYAKKQDALNSWYSTFLKQAGTARTLRWIAEPELERFQITMQDGRGTHRVVADRYAVTAKVVFAGNGN